MTNPRRLLLLAPALALLIAPTVAGGAEGAAPPSTAAFERATDRVLGSGDLAKPATARGGGLGTGSTPRGSLFPKRRLLTLYGAPQLTGTVLGKFSPAAAARKTVEQARPYARLGDRKVIPGFDFIAVVANSTPGPDRRYRTRQPAKLIRTYLRAVRSIDGRLVLDIQPGRAKVADEVDALERWISEPDVDISIDPEWEVGPHGVPGRSEGSIEAKEINRISQRLQRIIDENDLPPKALVVHQFRRGSVRGRKDIEQRPDVNVTLSFDGIGSPRAKRAGYRALSSPAAFNGFSIFYSLDTRIMSPASALGLDPPPDFLLFQ